MVSLNYNQLVVLIFIILGPDLIIFPQAKKSSSLSKSFEKTKQLEGQNLDQPLSENQAASHLLKRQLRDLHHNQPLFIENRLNQEQILACRIETNYDLVFQLAEVVDAEGNKTSAPVFSEKHKLEVVQNYSRCVRKKLILKSISRWLLIAVIISLVVIYSRKKSSDDSED